MSEFYRRKLDFSGQRWLVKGTDTLEGPGPNYFSDDEESVWVDGEGRLHVKIGEREGQWRCAEVVSEEAFGYGQYVFELGGGADAINENVVLGLFTWDTDPAHSNREIDIEIARWGEADNENCQYVVQPYKHPGNLHRFGVDLAGAGSTHSFEWGSGRVAFRSARGDGEGALIDSWIYTGADTPPPGEAKARINLWLFQGAPPSDGREVEVVVARFGFTR